MKHKTCHCKTWRYAKNNNEAEHSKQKEMESKLIGQLNPFTTRGTVKTDF